MMRKWALVLVVLLVLAGRSWARDRHDSAVFVVDVSGTVTNAGDVKAAQSIIEGMNERFPDYVKSAGTLTFGKAREAQLMWAAPVEKYSRVAIDQGALGLRGTDGPTPLGAALRKVDQGLDLAVGKTALIIVSDGLDNGFTDPVEAARALKKKHGDNLCIFTIQLGADPEGAALLKKLVEVGECGKGETAAGLKSPQALQGLVDYIFPPPAKPVAPPPPVAKPAPIGDADGDGVLDNVDQCPGTPKGAKVDPRGCWVLRDVKFDVNKYDLKPEYLPFLDEVVTVLMQNSGIKVTIEGHTDSSGSDALNNKLSNDRAKAVMNYFVSKGVDPGRLSAVGFGKNRPIATNDTEEGKAQNRRIELSVKQ
jgi:OmpA-OmpF porin, OOP family